jgi:hypothetical protein
LLWKSDTIPGQQPTLLTKIELLLHIRQPLHPQFSLYHDAVKLY